jgi:hypothetical protein
MGSAVTFDADRWDVVQSCSLSGWCLRWSGKDLGADDRSQRQEGDDDDRERARSGQQQEDPSGDGKDAEAHTGAVCAQHPAEAGRFACGLACPPAADRPDTGAQPDREPRRPGQSRAERDDQAEGRQCRGLLVQGLEHATPE